MQSVQDKVPNIHAQNDMPISDSCNCFRDCNVSCCFPRRMKKCQKHEINRKKSIHDDYEQTANKIDTTSSNIIKGKK